MLWPFRKVFNLWIDQFSLTLQCCWILEFCSAQGKCLGSYRKARANIAGSTSTGQRQAYSSLVGVSGPVYVALCPRQATFRKDSQIFDSVVFIFLKNGSGGIGIFPSSFWNMTNETHLLFSSALWLFFQILLPRFGVFSDCLERKKKNETSFRDQDRIDDY